MDTKNIRVTKEWLEEREPCKRAKRDFLRRYPKGLTLNRRNLYRFAEEFPLSYLDWFALCILGSGRYWSEIHHLTLASDYEYVRSPAKKRAVAKTLADALGL